MVKATSVEDAIAALRGMEDTVVVNLSVSKVLELVAALKSGAKSRAAIERELGLSAEQVLDTIVDLGVWLGQSQSQKGAPSCEVISWETIAVDSKGQFRLLLDASDDIVVLPDGFERKSCGRDVTRAFRSVVNASISEETVLRWLMRRQHHIHVTLTYSVVCGLYGVVALGRGAELEDLVVKGKWRNPGLARRLVAAWDLLEYSRRDAVTACENLLHDLSWQDVADNARRARWLDEAAMGRLITKAEQATISAAHQSSARRELAVVRRRVAETAPGSVKDMNAGMVRRICQAAGLDCERSAYDHECKVREMIDEAGLTADKDVLYPDGLLVVAAGKAAEFAEALARRKQGRLDWADDLNRALAAAER